MLSRAHFLDQGQPLAELQRCLQGIGQAGPDPFADNQAIDDHLDGVLFLLVQGNLLFEFAHLAVHANADVAAAAHLFKQTGILSLAAAHQGSEHLQADPLRKGDDLIDHLLHRLPVDGAAAAGAVGAPDAGEEQAQVVIDLGNRTHGGAGIARCGLLIDADRRREPLDLIEVGLFHLAQKLARISGERFDIAPLPFRVDGVKSQRRLARPAQPGKDNEPVARQGQVDIFKIVLPGTVN